MLCRAVAHPLRKNKLHYCDTSCHVIADALLLVSIKMQPGPTPAKNADHAGIDNPTCCTTCHYDYALVTTCLAHLINDSKEIIWHI
jgi:hypothetical protein